MTEQEVKLSCLQMAVDQLPNRPEDLQIGLARTYHAFIIERMIVSTPTKTPQVKEMKYG